MNKSEEKRSDRFLHLEVIISILFIHAVTHIGHIKLSSKTGASKSLLLIATLFTLLAMLLALMYVSKESNQVVNILAGFGAIALLTELTLQKFLHKKIIPRISIE